MEAKENTRLIGMLGFAMRAGKVVIGTDLVCRQLATGSVRLVLVSSGASDNTKKKILNKCLFYSVRAIVCEIEPERLGALLGKLYAPSAVAILDGRFAEEIAKAHDTQEQPLQRKDVSK